MTTLNERGDALQNKYFKDEELEFKTISRRRKLLGLWAADISRMGDEESLEYALSIVRYGIDHQEDGAVVKKILKDVEASGLNITEQEVREKMTELHRQAIMEVEKQFQEGTL